MAARTNSEEGERKKKVKSKGAVRDTFVWRRERAATL
jgi:hypothetical protein